MLKAPCFKADKAKGKRQSAECNVFASQWKTKEQKFMKQIWTSVLGGWLCLCVPECVCFFLCAATSWKSWRSAWRSQKAWLCSLVNMWVHLNIMLAYTYMHIRGVGGSVSASLLRWVWWKRKERKQTWLFPFLAPLPAWLFPLPFLWSFSVRLGF